MPNVLSQIRKFITLGYHDNDNENYDFTFENDMTKKQFSLKLKKYLLEKLEFNCLRQNCSECS